MGERAVSIPRNLSDFLHAVGVQIYADPYGVTSQDNDVTKKESDRFNELTEEAKEIILTTGMRLKTRIQSLEQAQNDYFKTEVEFLGSLLDFAEDPSDDFETGYSKARRSEDVEERYAAAAVRYNFELRDAAKGSTNQACNY